MSIIRQEVKKKIFSFLQDQWKETEIFFQRQRKEPSENAWLCVYLQEATKAVTRKNIENILYNINLSLFSISDNAYVLESYEDKLSDLLENRILNTERFSIQFQEFSTIDLEEEGNELEKTISHKSINCVVSVWTK